MFGKTHLILLLAVSLCALFIASASSRDRLVVDFSQTQGEVKHNAGGLLIPWGSDPVEPPIRRNAELVEPLNLKWVRHNLPFIVENKNRVAEDTNYIVNLSGGSYPWTSPPPYQNNFREWLDKVEAQVKLAQANEIDVIWDIWNEPEGMFFVGDDFKIRGKSAG